ncbi:MAG: serine hydrolase [Minisyncoccia bacterium]
MRGKFVASGVLITIFLLGFASDRLFFPTTSGDNCVSDFTFIRQNLDCNLSDKKIQNLGVLEGKIKEDILGYQEQGKVTRVSVFARDILSSRFVGVNENEMFYMASLLKIPVLVGGYKLAEVEPRLLDQEILYTGKPNLYDGQNIKPIEVLEMGKSYTVRELMRRAVVYSDNTAAQLLYDYYPVEFLDRIMEALGLSFTMPQGVAENFVTARTYANVFRSLYNSSYLTREYSNEALSFLTKTTYSDGATAKLPKDVLVAHKFAERSTTLPSAPQRPLRQLHECGLVYAKNGAEPYTFCILTEGSDYEALQNVLQDLSLEIYTAMIDDTGN